MIGKVNQMDNRPAQEMDTGSTKLVTCPGGGCDMGISERFMIDGLVL